jgi:putative phosphoesterase
LKWHSRLRDIGKQQGVDFIIYGHSHIPIIDESSKPILVNPGSISLPRSENMQKTYMIIEFNGTEANIKIEPCIR